ncbi:CD83 antigen [Lynx canadensis]|uniref:CD83 antigen n=1 Tax=Lynx canadensis TaxID=61383 RepID=UPI0011B06C4F|nr:CD83 antigen [Lynx canadensis]
MSRGLRLLLLSCACSLAPAARVVKVACSEDVDLPCTAHWDPQVSYTVFWTKLTGDCEERIEMPPEGLWYHQQKDGSLEASGERLYSLKIENTTSVDSGTYRCILEEPEGRRNQSGTVTLKVTGEPTKGLREGWDILMPVLFTFSVIAQLPPRKELLSNTVDKTEVRSLQAGWVALQLECSIREQARVLSGHVTLPKAAR